MKKEKKYKIKYRLSRKNEGGWIKCMAIDKNGIIRKVGLSKEVREWIKKHTPKLGA